MAKSFVLRAGPKAQQLIAQNGFTPDAISAFGAPAGGPKFLVLTQLDEFLFGSWLGQRQQPLPAFGSSIGAFRLVAAAHRDPAAAFKRMVDGYCAQRFDHKPTAAELTQQIRQFVSYILQEDDYAHILEHPWLQLNLITTRCHGLAGSTQTAAQLMGFGLAYLSNLRHRDALAKRFERCVFHTGSGMPKLLLPDAFRTHYNTLTRDNLATVTLASGTIPLIMESVRDIPTGPSGAHIDGGMIDYHMDLPLADAGSKGILFIPHYEQRVVPGWFDKHLKSRSARYTDRMLVLSPSAELVASLPGGRIPSRQDFKIYHQRDDDRLKAWYAAVAASGQIAEEFQEMLQRGDMAAHLQPL